MNDISEGNVSVSELLCFSLYSTHHSMNRLYKSLLKDIGLTYPQLLVLMALWEKDDQLVGEIGKTLFLNSNTLTPLIKRLESMEYVVRKRDTNDERKVLVSLTSAGKRLQGSTHCFPNTILEASGMNLESAIDLIKKITSLRESLSKYIREQS